MKPCLSAQSFAHLRPSYLSYFHENWYRAKFSGNGINFNRGLIEFWTHIAEIGVWLFKDPLVMLLYKSWVLYTSVRFNTRRK